MNDAKAPVLYDRYLLAAIIALLSIGLLMVASASMVISDRIYGEPFYFLLHQAVYIAVGIGIGAWCFRYRVQTWNDISGSMLLVSILLLALVLVPGIGHEVNGSVRWIGIGPIGIEVSEFAKLAFILYLSSYLVRREKEVRSRMRGFLKPLVIMGVMAILLLREPDFGTTAVIAATALAMLFLAGVRIWQFGLLLGAAVLIFSLLAISSPYRLERLTTFMHPWQNAYASGYQLTQSLIAFGHGGFWGVGLGHSVQKLYYLPEAHTDFLFAVLTEELGLFGALVVIAFFVLLITRAMIIGYSALKEKLYFGAYCAYGIGIWLAIQATISIGVNTGLFPTKGLTLPLMSYGGGSMLITCFALMLLFRIDHEARIYHHGLQRDYFPQ